MAQKRTPYRPYDPYGSQAPIGRSGQERMYDVESSRHETCRTCGQLTDEHDPSRHILSGKQFPRKRKR